MTRGGIVLHSYSSERVALGDLTNRDKTSRPKLKPRNLLFASDPALDLPTRTYLGQYQHQKQPAGSSASIHESVLGRYPKGGKHLFTPPHLQGAGKLPRRKSRPRSAPSSPSRPSYPPLVPGSASSLSYTPTSCSTTPGSAPSSSLSTSSTVSRHSADTASHLMGAELRRRLGDLQTQILTQQDALKHSQNALKEAQAAQAESRAEISELTSKLEAQTKLSQTLHTTLDAQLNTSAALHTEIDELKRVETELGTRNGKIAAQADSALSLVSDFEHELAQSDKQALATQTQIEKYGQAIHLLRQKIQSLQSDNLALADQITQLKALVQSQASSIQQQEHEMASLTADIASMNDQLQAIPELEQALKDTKEQLEQAREHNAVNTKALQSAEHAKQEYLRLAEQLKKKVTAVELKAMHEDQRNKELCDVRDRLHDKINELRSTHRRVNAEVAKRHATTLQWRTTIARTALIAQRTKFSQSSLAQEAELKQLKASNLKLRRDLGKTQESLSELQASVALTEWANEQRVAQADADVQHIKSVLEKADTQSRSAIRNLESELAQVKQQYTRQPSFAASTQTPPNLTIDHLTDSITIRPDYPPEIAEASTTPPSTPSLSFNSSIPFTSSLSPIKPIDLSFEIDHLNGSLQTQRELNALLAEALNRNVSLLEKLKDQRADLTITVDGLQKHALTTEKQLTGLRSLALRATNELGISLSQTAKHMPLKTTATFIVSTLASFLILSASPLAAMAVTCLAVPLGLFTALSTHAYGVAHLRQARSVSHHMLAKMPAIMLATGLATLPFALNHLTLSNLAFSASGFPTLIAVSFALCIATLSAIQMTPLKALKTIHTTNNHPLLGHRELSLEARPAPHAPASLTKSALTHPMKSINQTP